MNYNKRSEGIKCKISKIPSNLKNQKTIVVSMTKKLLNSKYKRYYLKTYSRLVHYEGEDPISVGEQIMIHECRRISAHKSAIYYGKGS